MARPKKNLAPAAPTSTPESQALATMVADLAQQGFADQDTCTQPADGGAVAMLWGSHQGNPTPRVMALALPENGLDRSTPESVQALSFTVLPPTAKEDQYPTFAVVVSHDGKAKKILDLSSPPHEIDVLPTLAEIGAYTSIKADKTYRWSMAMSQRLMKGFNQLHERIYQIDKDKVNGKNDIIEEIAKLLFLESFRLHHSGSLEFKDKAGAKHDLHQVFTAAYVRQHKQAAVDVIAAAFESFKKHPDYVVTDDQGTQHPIFDDNTHIRLSKHTNILAVLELIQELGPVTDNQNKEVKPKGSLGDIAADVLGRVFDVFLRANFESKGGLGIYLTPAPVKQAMLEMLFHDLVAKEPQVLTGYDAAGKPLFRFCDPACGSGGFLALALTHTRRALDKVNLDNVRRERLWKDMLAHSFVGADASPQMVMLARVNLALLGAPKAHIFWTDDSRVSPQLKPCSFAVICTNPPFGTPKFKKTEDDAKAKFNADMQKVLEQFRTDLVPQGEDTITTNPLFNDGVSEKKKVKIYDYQPTVSGLAMGGAPTEKKGKTVWREATSTIDPAVLFLDRCIQMIRPGGRLMIVLPDGVLCNSGDRYVREYVMGRKDETDGQFHGGKAVVQAVISLPNDAFKLSGTGAKTSVLYLRKRLARKDDPKRFQDEPQTDVFMAVADTLGYVVKNNVEDYSAGVPNDLANIVGAYVRGQ